MEYVSENTVLFLIPLILKDAVPEMLGKQITYRLYAQDPSTLVLYLIIGYCYFVIVLFLLFI